MSYPLHFIRRVTAITLASGLLLTAAPAAQAQMGSPNITMGDLGLGDMTTFRGQSAEIPFNIAVPPGTNLEALVGTFQLPAEFSGGLIEVYGDDRLLDSIPLEVMGFLADVEIPLDRIEVVDGYASFMLRAVMDVKGNQWCVEEPELRFLDGEVRYAGEIIKPEVVADFLPPILRVLSIYVPANPSDYVQQATLDVTTTLASVYRSTSLNVQVLRLAEGKTEPTTIPEDGERQIVISDSGAPGLELMNPGADDLYLKLSGQNDQVTDQARLLADSLLPLAADDQVAASGFGAIPEISTEMATLNELGNYDLESESVARTMVSIGIERAQLRPFAGSYEIHLTGSYTPLPASHGGQISMRVGDEVLDFFTADNSGVIDRTFTIPGDEIERYTELQAEYRTTGDVSCGSTQPVGLSIDGDSMVTATHTDVPLQSGFQSLPQAFQPMVDVAMSQGDVVDLSRAVSLMVGVQSLSSQHIRPQVIRWEEAVESKRPTLFIDADGERTHELPLYVSEAKATFNIVSSEEGGGVKGTDDPADMELARQLSTNSSLSAGALQSVWDEETGRMILVASSNGNASQLDGIIGWLAEDRSRWAGLQGDVLARVMDREPVELKVSESLRQPAARPIFWTAVAVSALVISIAIAVSIFVSRRSNRIKGEEVLGQGGRR